MHTFIQHIQRHAVYTFGFNGCMDKEYELVNWFQQQSTMKSPLPTHTHDETALRLEATASTTVNMTPDERQD